MPKSIKSSRLGDFVAIEVRDIEHVYDLIKVRADFGNLQIQLKFKEYFRNVVEQSNSVVGKDGNDRVAFRCAIVESNLGWLCSNFGVRPNAVALFVEIRRKFDDYFSCDRQKNSLAFQRSFLHGTRQSR